MRRRGAPPAQRRTRSAELRRSMRRRAPCLSFVVLVRVCVKAEDIISTRVFPSVVIRIETYPNRVETVAFGSDRHVEHPLYGTLFFENGIMLDGGGFICLRSTCFQCRCCFVMCTISMSQEVQAMVVGHHSCT